MRKLKIDYKESLLNAQKYITELEKENAELKSGCGMCYRKDKEQLTKATELLKEAQGYIENINDVLYDEIEQFIKEI